MRHLGTAAAAVGLMLLLTGCTASSATPSATGSQPYPSALSNAASPTPATPSTPAPHGTVSGLITPAEASTDQLSAQLYSLLNDSDHDRAVAAFPAGIKDFSNVITARCYPDLPSEQSAELDGLRTQLEAATGEQALTLAGAYFDRASDLCT